MSAAEQTVSPKQAALALAEEHGLPVLPCRSKDEWLDGKLYKAKSPYLEHGFKDASCNIEEISRWWERWPDALIGVRTGSASNLFVIDIDPRALEWYRMHATELAAGRVHKTRRGFHLLYRYREGLDCKSGSLPDGVDVRGDGGFIVWWPGHGLEVTGDLEEVGDLPPWVRELLQKGRINGHERSDAIDSRTRADGIGVDRSADLLRRVARDVRGGLADYEILSRHLAHPHAQEQSDPKRAVQRCIEKARTQQKDQPPSSATLQGDWQPPAVVGYGAEFDPAAIPKRQWLLGRRRSVGELTIDAGPPGVNKSTLMLSDAVQIATGRRILDDDVHRRGGVLFLAGEDARRDVEARLAGILTRHHIEPAELGGRLRVVYLGEIDAATYSLAAMIEDMAMLNSRMFEWLREYADTVAVFIDPIAAWHGLIENSNEALQLLCASLRGLAVRGQRHVGFDHHVTKISQFDCEAHVGNLPALRGASAIAAAARWAFTLARLRPETAAAHGIEETERGRYRRLDPLKASYGPDDGGARLLRVESVPIANGETVGVLVEVDTTRTREQAAERREMASADARKRLTEALARMLREKAPRSGTEAALWLASHEPTLYLDEKKRTPLSYRTVYRRLAVDIGTGLDAGTASTPLRIVLKMAGKGNGARWEIDFEQRGIE